MRYNGGIGFGDFPFFKLTRDDLFDLVLEAEGDFCHVDRGKGGGREIGAGAGKDCATVALAEGTIGRERELRAYGDEPHLGIYGPRR